jgi:hypothetical protein
MSGFLLISGPTRGYGRCLGGLRIALFDSAALSARRDQAIRRLSIEAHPDVPRFWVRGSRKNVGWLTR